MIGHYNIVYLDTQALNVLLPGVDRPSFDTTCIQTFHTF